MIFGVEWIGVRSMKFRNGLSVGVEVVFVVVGCKKRSICTTGGMRSFGEGCCVEICCCKMRWIDSLKQSVSNIAVNGQCINNPM